MTFQLNESFILDSENGDVTIILMAAGFTKFESKLQELKATE